jgi:hypothetical protein
MLAASLLTGLAFAVSHDLGALVGDQGLPFRLDYFVIRTLLPGFVMSMAFFVIGPGFIVAAHCTAHLWIPFLFH